MILHRPNTWPMPLLQPACKGSCTGFGSQSERSDLALTVCHTYMLWLEGCGLTDYCYESSTGLGEYSVF